jgi:hypothetical protein
MGIYSHGMSTIPISVYIASRDVLRLTPFQVATCRFNPPSHGSGGKRLSFIHLFSGLFSKVKRKIPIHPTRKIELP